MNNDEIKIRLEATTEQAAQRAADQIAVSLADDAIVTFYTLSEMKAGWRYEGVIRQKDSSTAAKNSLLTIDYVTLKRFVKVVNEEDATKLVSARVPKLVADYLTKWVFRTSLKRKVSKEKVVGLALALFFATHPMPPDEDEI